MTLISSLGSQKKMWKLHFCTHCTHYHISLSPLLTTKPLETENPLQRVTLMVKCSQSLGCVVEVSIQLSAGTLADFFTCLNPTALHPQHPGASAADLNRQCRVLRKRITQTLLPTYAQRTSFALIMYGGQQLMRMSGVWEYFDTI